MSGTTTNYAFPYPSGTDLAKLGASDIQDLADSVDTALNAALATKPTGLVLLNMTTFSAVASISVNNIFSATYDDYRIVVNGYANANADVTFRFRASGTDYTSANYQYASQGFFGTSRNDVANINQTSIGFTPSLGDNRGSAAYIDVFRPYSSDSFKGTVATEAYSHSSVGLIVRNVAGILNSTTQFDGFTLGVTGLTITGTIRVYGYKNS